MNITEQDYFDLLPDALLLFIFNKVSDAKSLVRCLSVSKRFASLASQSGTISISLPPRKPYSKPIRPGRGLYMSLLKTLAYKFFSRPLKSLHNVIAPKPAFESDHASYYMPNEVLKHFKEVKSLHIELPANETGDSLLKWKARFGYELQSCVILGATSFQKRKLFQENSGEEHRQQADNNIEQTLTDDELKLRVAWTISCLVAASARHCLLKQILAEHHKLEDVILTDAKKQGEFSMEKDQVVEMNSMKQLMTLESSSSSLERTQVPDLSIKLWYVPVLELPATGYLMNGATLVVIRPEGKVEKGSEYRADALLSFDGEGCEKKAFDEAVRKLVKMRKSYVLKMSSF